MVFFISNRCDDTETSRSLERHIHLTQLIGQRASTLDVLFELRADARSRNRSGGRFDLVSRSSVVKLLSKSMKRTPSRSLQTSAVPSGANLFGIGAVGDTHRRCPSRAR